MAKKQTPEERAAANAAAEARRSLIDEYAKLDAELASARPKLRRLDELAKQLRAAYDATPAGLTVIEDGHSYQIVVGPKAEQTRIVSMAAVCEAMGHDKFIAVSTLTLKALEAALGAQAAQLTVKERTGSRSLKAIPRAA